MKIDFSRNQNIFFLLLIIAIQLVVCLPHLGRGFINDDFIWIDNALTEGRLDFRKPFIDSTGFYRPLISLSFGVQYYCHGMNARPYARFNLFIHIFNIILLFLFLRLFEPFKNFALPVAFLFSLNIKSNPMAIGWISGRTSLLFVFFSLLTLIMTRKAEGQVPLKRNLLYSLAGLFFLAALFSKETAIMIPLLVFLFSFPARSGRSKSKGARFRHALKTFCIFVVPLGIYFFLRLNSNAFSPFNSPATYSLGFNPPVILKNLWEYFLRAGMLDFILLCCLFILGMGKWKNSGRLKFGFDPVKAGILWFMVFLLPVLFLNVRSDLYVYFPQVGLHLASVSFMVYLWRIIEPAKKRLAYKFFVVLPLLVVLAVWVVLLAARMSAYARTGNQSHRFIQGIVETVPRLPGRARLVVFDLDIRRSDSPRQTIAYGFNSALKLFYFYPARQLSGEITLPRDFFMVCRIRRSHRFFFWQNHRLRGPYDGQTLWKMSRLLFAGLDIPRNPARKNNVSKTKWNRLQRRRRALKRSDKTN